jgi:hypothetical protein
MARQMACRSAFKKCFFVAVTLFELLREVLQYEAVLSLVQKGKQKKERKAGFLVTR